jgi:hypothetical protein
MNRSNWKFSYTADILCTAATAKREFHSERHKWWSDKRDETKERIKSEGIEIDESVAANQLAGSYSNSAFRGPSVSIRNDLVTDLNECVAKVAEHHAKIKDYDAWIQVLESQGKATLDLQHDDWLFFFGKR